MTVEPHRRQPAVMEWQTASVAATIHGGWLLLTAFHDSVPPALLFPLGGWLIAWHGSLQHETIHGHPTRWPWINAAIGSVPFALWLPYAVYRRSHVEHHRSPAITDPHLDPESRYAAGRSPLATLQSTLTGRLAAGPFIAVGTFLAQELARAAARPRDVAKDWLPHLAGVACLLGWLCWCGLGLDRYLLLFVYPGTALSLLRSFAEHRADMTTSGRAASVETAGPLALLYLNNQLHAAHHERPDLAWYRLPAYHRDHRDRLTDDGRARYDGYGEIARRFALRPQHVVIHPTHGGES